MLHPGRCTYCGARLEARATSCAFCGTSIGPPPDAVRTSGARDVDFRRLDEHPQLAELLAARPSRAPLLRRLAVRLVFGLVFSAAAAGVAWQSARGSFPHPAPLLFVVIGLVLAGGAAWELARTRALPIRALGAGVLAVRAGGEERPSRRSLELVLRGGQKRVWRGATGVDLRPGDVGVAYLLGERVIDFRPLP